MKNRKLSFRSNPAFGFSVVELIVALTIMTIIVTVGFSAYTYAQTNYGTINKRLNEKIINDENFKTNFFSHFPNNNCPTPLNQDALKTCYSLIIN